MPLKSTTLRAFTTLHTWIGVVAGFALFVAFYAGAITVFHHDLPRWQMTAAEAARAPDTLDDAQRLLDGVLSRHAGARQWFGMLFPGEESARALAYWQGEDGTWLYATLDTLEGSPTPPQSGLAELINALHYSLGLPVAGIYLMGIISLLYGVAILSGLVIHLPKLAKDLFALRPGRNLKRFWQDAHNVVGVLGLPMHLMFALTGALLCLSMVLAAALNPLIYDGKLMDALPAAMDTAPVRPASGHPVELGTLAMWHARSVEITRERVGRDFEPAYLKLVNAGDANATVEITGASPGALGPLGAVALDANTGAILTLQLPGQRDANHATLASAYALHFGEYAHALIPWLYFVLGLSGAFLFYSGNLLWIESRRKRRQPEQSRAAVNMARATVGVCVGHCASVSAAFVAAQVFAALWPGHVDAGIRWTCFVVWGACALWAAVRTPAQAARELLWTCAIVTAAIPLAHGFATNAWPWRSLAIGNAPAFWIDLVALLVAFGFGCLAKLSTRRARAGQTNSVWAETSIV